MSLTRLLADPKGPLTRLFLEWFPHHTNLQIDVAEAAPSLVQAPPAGYAPGTQGAAAHWLIQLSLDPLLDLTPAVRGWERTPRSWPARRLGGQLFAALGARPSQLKAPADVRQGWSPARLAGTAYALALFTELWRTPRALQGTRLHRLSSSATLGHLLALATADEMTDLLALRLFGLRRLQPLQARTKTIISNLVFTGSPDVGHAEADLLLGRTLVELKSSAGKFIPAQGRHRLYISRQEIHQLLGYILLDYDNAYQLEAVAWHALRYDYIIRWPLSDFLAELAGQPVNLARRRQDFRTFVRSLRS